MMDLMMGQGRSDKVRGAVIRGESAFVQKDDPRLREMGRRFSATELNIYRCVTREQSENEKRGGWFGLIRC